MFHVCSDIEQEIVVVRWAMRSPEALNAMPSTSLPDIADSEFDENQNRLPS